MWNSLLTVGGILLIFLSTALGASVVFFFKGEISPKINAVFFGFASGVMLAASIWSLIIPALNALSITYGKFSFMPVALALLLGGAFLILLDKTAKRLKGNNGITSGKAQRLFLAVTLHNIPEGLAVGFAFGAAAASGFAAAYATAFVLALGIAFQNMPEGAAVALPVKTALKNNKKAFLWGVGSGIVEPIFAVIGYFLATGLRALQPWLLAFSAGAMIFVTADDLLPDSKMQTSQSLGAWSFLIGFILMMALDTALG